MSYIIYFLLDVVITGFIFWCASKLTFVDLRFKETVFAVCAASLVSFIPFVGWLASVIVLLYLLSRFSGSDIWPNLIVMVVVVKVISFVISIFLIAA